MTVLLRAETHTRMRHLVIAALMLCSTKAFCQQLPPSDSLRMPGEKHFKNVRQLTFGGDNAEAYFSFKGDKLVFQFTNHNDVPCDQIFYSTIPTTPLQTFQYNRISNGKGRTTCSYFLPGDSLVLYASTFLASDTCLESPDRTKIKKYVWGVFGSYEIFIADLNGNIKKQLTHNDYYDAEATVSPKGDKILFTSDRDGDLDLYTMNLDGSNVKRITNTLGYDGGAFFSPDGKQIVWRASRPTGDSAVAEYKELLAKGLVAPTQMDLYVANVDVQICAV
jgi:TolB protein